MRRKELSLLVERYQYSKDNGQLQNASEATMRTWIDELLSMFDWDVQNTQQVLTEHSLGRTERARLHEIGSTNIRPDYTLVNGKVQLAFVDAKSLSVDIANDRSASFYLHTNLRVKVRLFSDINKRINGKVGGIYMSASEIGSRRD